MTVTVDAPFVSLPLKVLHESPTNPRRMFEEKPMQELIESVRQFGVLQPILVRDRQQPGDAPGTRYEIVAGARRFRAAREAGLLEVPCIVRELTDRLALEVQFIENLQREGLHPLDEGYGYRRLHDEHAYTVEQLAEKLNKSKAYVYGRMQLAKLPVKAQTLFLEGKIDLSHAQLVTRIPVPELADKAAASIAKGDERGSPMPYRVAVEFVRRNYQCNLLQAPFPTSDRDLVPEAGPCGKCPNRSGNQKDLFGGADGVGQDSCLDPTCFELKTKRFFAHQKDEVVAKGGKVMEGKKASEAQHSYSLVDPDSACNRDPKQRTWKQLCKGQQMHMVLLQGRDGQALWRWDRAAAEKAGFANGHEFLRKEKAKPAVDLKGEMERIHEMRRIDDLVEQRLAPLVVEKAEGMDCSAALRLALPCLHADKAVCDRRGFKSQSPKDVAKAVAALSIRELQGLLVELVWADAGTNPTEINRKLGIDPKKVRAEIVAQEKAKAKAAAKAAAMAGAKKTPKAKKAKPGRKAKVAEAHDVYHGAIAGRGGSPRMGD